VDGQVQDVLQRIRRFALPEGPIDCRGIWLRQVGEMRFGPARAWSPFEAEQWLEGPGIDFRWRARVRMAPLVRASVVDSFEHGRGLLVARVLGLIPVVRSRGVDTDAGEAMRGLAELPWRPFAFREGPPFGWEARGASGLGATFDDGRTRVAVEFDVDGEGRVRGAAVPRRPRLVGRTTVETAWSGRFSEYRVLDGLRVPTAAEVSWALPEGPFTYWRGRVLELKVLPRGRP
jgi:hypothetical protein